ncbi:hypothetical protein L7F22_068403 [Adiantum nelumboides]|nr:hypothetical protein [Adiantum nelumboides]
MDTSPYDPSCYYDVSWLVSGMIVREWASFCPCSPPSCVTTMPSSSNHSQQINEPDLAANPNYLHQYVVDMAPPVLSFDSLMPGVSQHDMLRFSGLSYALRSLQFWPSSNPHCDVPSLWLERPAKYDEQHHESILQWLSSPSCSISRLIVANACGEESIPFVYSILDALKRSLRPNSSIQHLGFYNCSLSESAHWEYLITMLTSSKCPIQTLLFAHLRSPGVRLRSLIQILQDPQSKISELLIHGDPVGLEPKQNFNYLLRVLQKKTSSLQRLSLTCCRLQDEKVCEISNLLKSATCNITGLNLSSNSFTESALQSLQEALVESYSRQNRRSDQSSRHASGLSMLSVCGSDLYLRDKTVTSAMTKVMEAPHCCLEALDLTGRSADPDWLLALSRILQRSTCRITSLYLFHALYVGSDHAPANESLIQALKINKHIRSFQFPWASEAYRQIAEFVLERNIRLQRSGLVKEDLVEPRCAKLFLCGHGRVGKTTLRTNLLKPTSLKHVGRRLAWSTPDVTRGMNLSTLQLDDSSLVICDLAGQREYHALHHFFMNSSNEDLFAIVCKYEEPISGLKEDLIGFNARLEYWLRFIVSHRTQTHPKPIVMLVVNFFGCKKKKGQMLDIARVITKAAVQKFESLLDFGQEACNVLGVQLNSSKPARATRPIQFVLKDLTTKLLRNRNPIFKICNDIASAIHEGQWQTSGNKKAPLMTTVGELMIHYKAMCSSNEKFTLPANDAGFEESLLELHKTGQVVFFKSAASSLMHKQAVILNPTWFYETLVGSFVAPMLRPIQESNGSNHLAQYGIWREDAIGLQILEHAQCERDDIDRILHYLEKLEFFFVVKAGPPRELLFPTILPDEGSHGAPSWHPQDSLSQCFFGRRLECEDSEHSLLPWGVFTRLQVQLHAVYGRDTTQYRVGYGWISLTSKGVEAFIRLGGADSQWEDRHWIDIMARCTPGSMAHGDREVVAEAIISNAKNSVFQICQGMDRGCAGIRLQELILLGNNSSCTEAVPLAKAKEQVRLQGIVGDCSHAWFNDPTEAPPRVNASMSKLFMPTEVHEFSMQNAAGIGELKKDFGGLIQGEHGDALLVQLSQEERRVYNIFSANMRLELGHHIRTVVAELEKTRKSIYAAVSEQLMRREGAVGGAPALPGCPYLTDGEGKWRKLREITKVKQARLQLMCECVEGYCHRVEGQMGVVVTLESPEWLARVAPALIPGLKLVYGAAKIAASIFMPGVHPFLPDADGLLGALGLPQKISIQSHSEAFPLLLASYLEGLPQVPRNLAHLQANGLPREPLLREFYRFALEGRAPYEVPVMTRDFLLYHVYVPAKGATRWVCRDHIGNGELLPPTNPFEFLA